MNTIKTDLVDYDYLDTKEDLIELIETIKSTKSNIYGCDTEVHPDIELHGASAKWNDPHTSTVRLFQLMNEDWDHPVIVDVLKIADKKSVLSLIEELSKEEYIKVFHNAQYDLKVIRNNFGIWMKGVWCTKILMQRLGLCVGFKNSKLRKHTYASLASNYFGIDISKIEQASDWSNVNLSSSQLIYAALDVGAPKNNIDNIKSILLSGYREIKRALEEEYKVKESLQWDIEAALVITQIEYNGMPLSTNTLKAVMGEVSNNLNRLRTEIAKTLKYKVTSKPIFINGKPQIEYIVSPEVSKALNNPKKMVDRINSILYEESLTDLTKDSLFALLKSLEKKKEQELEQEQDKSITAFEIDIITKIINYKKLLKMNGTDYLSMINPITKCLHSNYQVIGAASGRLSSGKSDLSSEGFNAQQLSTIRIVIPEIENPFESFSEKVIK